MKNHLSIFLCWRELDEFRGVPRACAVLHHSKLLIFMNVTKTEVRTTRHIIITKLFISIYIFILFFRLSFCNNPQSHFASCTWQVTLCGAELRSGALF